MTELFQRRQESELMSMLCKRIIAGIIGKLGQYIDDKPTPLTNPVYHSIIRNYAPLKVCQFLIDNEIRKDELIHINTDGFHTTRDLDLPEKASMGQWRKAPSEDLIVISSDNILEGNRCSELMAQIKQDGSNYRYGDLNLIYMAGDQDRYFPDFPTSGKELITKRYQSEPLVL
jgi:hypothetical protein